jgi:hypothetical protein
LAQRDVVFVHVLQVFDLELVVVVADQVVNDESLGTIMNKFHQWSPEKQDVDSHKIQ